MVPVTDEYVIIALWIVTAIVALAYRANAKDRAYQLRLQCDRNLKAKDTIAQKEEVIRCMDRQRLEQQGATESRIKELHREYRSGVAEAIQMVHDSYADWTPPVPIPTTEEIIIGKLDEVLTLVKPKTRRR